MRARAAIAATVMPGCMLACTWAVAAAAPQAQPLPLPQVQVQARVAITAIDACLPRLDAEADVGFERVAARCPGLATALEAGGVAALLPADWRRPRGELSAGGLRALRGALLAPPAPAPRRALPDVAVLEGLVATSRGATAAPGPWQRFLRWLRARVGDAAPGADERSGWARWLQERPVSERVWALLGYLALAGLVAFLGWVARAELRAVGWPGGRSARSSRAAAPVGDDERAGTAGLLEQLPMSERPAWLLRRLARSLQARGCLPSAPALTARELARDARLELEADRESLCGVALAAERVRYAAVPPQQAELEVAVGAALALLQRLESAPVRAAGSTP